MNATIIFSIVALLLFGASFFSRRRFGLLALALSAGTILSGIWNYDAGLIISSLGIVPKGQATLGMTTLILILLPAFVLLFAGKKYKSMPGKIVGSLLFAVLGVAFLADALNFMIGQNDIYSQFVKYKPTIIGVGIVLAIVDIFLAKPSHRLDKKSKH